MNPAIAQSLPIICLVVVGFMLKKARVLPDGDGAVLTRLILNVTLPAVIFLSIAGMDVEPARLARLALLGAAIPLITSVIAGWIIRRLNLPPGTAGVMLIGTMVMNMGAFLFPLVQTVYGMEGVSRLAAIELGNSLVSSSYVYYLASTYSAQPPKGIKASARRILSVPILWACVLGALVNLSGVLLPDFVLAMLKPVAAANTPLGMIALGTLLVFSFPQWRMMSLTVLMRMGLGFALGQFMIALFGLSGTERMAVGLGSAMPLGLITLVYSVTNGLDVEFAAATVSLSILTGLVAAPFMLLLY